MRSYRELEADERSTLPAQVSAQRERVAARLASVRHLLCVMSGKGGVGKSLVSTGLAAALARAGRRVGALDADLGAPTAARMLGVPRGPLQVGPGGIAPALAPCGVRVMSSDLLLPEGAPLRWREPAGAPFVWRGALEAGMLREFLGDVEWGPLDELVVDLPPGSERLATLVDLVPSLAGMVAVTIPSVSSHRAVSRALESARAPGVRLLGVVENMCARRCPRCGEEQALFAGDAGERLGREWNAPFVSRLPFDPALQEATDEGRTDAAADALQATARALVEQLEA
jgi:ATP-binding protein involved in chromosome partitioning